MIELYNAHTHKARKEHTCEFCSKVINVGEKYSYESGKYDGEFFTRKLCNSCANILMKYSIDTYEEEFDWTEISEWLKEGWCTDCPKWGKCELSPEKCEIIKNKFSEGTESKG